MVIKKREVEVQRNHTERLKVALEEANKSKDNVSNNLENFTSFVNETFKNLDTYEKEAKEKILDFTLSQREEYLKNVSRRMRDMEVNNKFGNKCFIQSFEQLLIELKHPIFGIKQKDIHRHPSNTQIFFFMQTKLRDMKQKRCEDNYQLVFQVERDIHNARIESLVYRSWIIDLYEEYCTALFYIQFEECENSFYSVITQNDMSVLSSLAKLEWDAIVENAAYKPPTYFKEVEINIEDGVHGTPIADFKQNK